jgi:hypothetical protein
VRLADRGGISKPGRCRASARSAPAIG